MLLAAGVVTACQPEYVCPPMNTVKSVDEIVAGYNKNASRVPRLWARVDVNIKLRKKPGDLPLLWNCDGIVMLDKRENPAIVPDFKLVLKEAGQRIGQIGTSTVDKVYYMWSKMGDNRSCYYGETRLAGAPDIDEIPIDPIQLLSVLCVRELPADFTRAPFVTQSISTNPCAYVLTYIDRQPVTNRFLARREIYFERRAKKDKSGNLIFLPCRPFMVKIFDNKGRLTFKATMKDYKPIELEDVDDDLPGEPEMPTTINLTWIKNGTELTLKLFKLSTGEEFDEDVFELWSTMPDDLKNQSQKIDKNYTPRK